MTQDNALSSINSLSAMDRIEARDNAKKIVIASHGAKPTQEDFKSYNVSKYPLWLQMTITALALIALIGAFTLSATNLNAIGRDTVAHSIHNANSIAVGGIAVVILAETAQIIFSLALALVDDITSKIVLYAGMVASTSIALVGNIEHAEPITWFHWLIAILPPMIVLGVGYVLKVQALHAVENRHEAKRQFQIAIAEYEKATAQPEQSPGFRAAYANALREMIIKVNAKGRGKAERRATMQSFTGDDWRYLIQQEIAADEWYTETPQAAYTTGKGTQVQSVIAAPKMPEITDRASVENFPELAISQNGNGHKNGNENHR